MSKSQFTHRCVFAYGAACGGNEFDETNWLGQCFYYVMGKVLNASVYRTMIIKKATLPKNALDNKH